MLNAEYHIKRILRKKFSQHIWNSMRATVTTNSMIYAKHNYSIRCISSNCRIMMKTFFRVFVKFAFQYTLHFAFKSTNVEIAFNFKLNLILCQFYAFIYLLIFSKVIFNSNQIQKYQYDLLKKNPATKNYFDLNKANKYDAILIGLNFPIFRFWMTFRFIFIGLWVFFSILSIVIHIEATKPYSANEKGNQKD